MISRPNSRGQTILVALAVVGAATVVVGGVAAANIFGLATVSLAQTEPVTDMPIKKAKKAIVTTAAPPAAKAAVATTPPAQPAVAGQATAAPAGDKGPGFQVMQQLQAAGVKTCLQTADGLGRFQMSGVTEYAAASTWNKTDPDKRLVSAVIGQRFGASAVAPLGLSGVVTGPNAEGKCDGVGIQVIPTASACSAVQADVLNKGELLGTLVGMPMMRNAQNQRVMLLPTAGNGCVIVGMNNYYSE
jgi:hypothetical protein